MPINPANWIDKETLTTLTVGIDDVTTAVTVANGALFPPTDPFYIKVDDEIMLVTAGQNTNNWTVDRAQLLSAPAVHSVGANVTGYTPTSRANLRDLETRVTAYADSLLNATAHQVKLKRTVAQSIAHSTLTSVQWTAEDYDLPNNDQHDNAVNNTRMICKKAGLYFVEASTNWAANATGIRQSYIRLNGATYLAGTEVSPNTQGPGGEGDVGSYVRLAVNDYVELIVRHILPVAGALNLGSDFNRLHFAMARISS